MKKTKVRGVTTKRIKKRNIAQLSTASSILLILILLLSSLSISICIAEEENEGKIGILVIAHGSPNEDWCAPVRDTVAEVDLPYPAELGFLEFVPNETINNAVEKLDDAGVTKIIAVPLFVSSHSSHIQEIEVEYLKGGSATELTAEIIPAISMTVPTTSFEFGKVGAGMSSEKEVITVVNTGSKPAKVSACCKLGGA